MSALCSSPHIAMDVEPRVKADTGSFRAPRTPPLYVRRNASCHDAAGVTLWRPALSWTPHRSDALEPSSRPPPRRFTLTTLLAGKSEAVVSGEARAHAGCSAPTGTGNASRTTVHSHDVRFSFFAPPRFSSRTHAQAVKLSFLNLDSSLSLLLSATRPRTLLHENPSPHRPRHLFDAQEARRGTRKPCSSPLPPRRGQLLAGTRMDLSYRGECTGLPCALLLQLETPNLKPELHMYCEGLTILHALLTSLDKVRRIALKLADAFRFLARAPLVRAQGSQKLNIKPDAVNPYLSNSSRALPPSRAPTSTRHRLPPRATATA